MLPYMFLPYSLNLTLHKETLPGCCCHVGAGRDKEEVRKDIGRNRYFTPEQAIECAHTRPALPPVSASYDTVAVCC